MIQPLSFWYSSKGNEGTIMKKYLPPHINHSIIHNNQDIEITECPLVYEWIKKTWYMYNEILLGHNKGNPIICTMDELGRLYAK